MPRTSREGAAAREDRHVPPTDRYTPYQPPLSKHRAPLSTSPQLELFPPPPRGPARSWPWLGKHSAMAAWVTATLYKKVIREKPEGSRNPFDHASCDKILPHHRAILIDWLSEVCFEVGLPESVLFLAVSLTDRFLCATERVIRPTEVQLVGVSCLTIAVKQDATTRVRICDLANLTAGACSKADIIEFENTVLRTVKFRVLSTGIDVIAPMWAGSFGAEEGSRALLYVKFLIECVYYDAALTGETDPGVLGFVIGALGVSTAVCSKVELPATMPFQFDPQEAIDLAKKVIRAVEVTVKGQDELQMHQSRVVTLRKYADSRWCSVTRILSTTRWFEASMRPASQTDNCAEASSQRASHKCLSLKCAR